MQELLDRPLQYNSQCGEDRWLAEHCDLPEHGVFVDVGAAHPTLCSNTYWLEQRGWDGVCIDADPRCVVKLQAGRKRVVQAAVSDVEVEMDFHIAPEIGFSGLKASGNGWIKLRTERLDTILERESIDEVTLISVDTEGTELDVLKSLGKYVPRYIIVEHLTWPAGGVCDPHRDELMAYLSPKYSLLYETNNNLILERTEEVEKTLLAKMPTLDTVNGLFARHERPINQSVCAVQSIPRYGSTAHGDCIFAMTHQLGIKTNRQTGVYWDQCLTRAMAESFKVGYEYILTIDHDTIFTPGDVCELWRLMKKCPEIDALCGCQMRRGIDQPLMMHTDETGIYWLPITPENLKEETVRLKTAHFGLTMFRCLAFEAMKKPWFIPVPDSNGEWEAGHIDSDINFWSQWWDAGNSLHQANHVIVGHLQEMVSWPNDKLLPIHQYHSAYAEYGKPKDTLNYREPNDA